MPATLTPPLKVHGGKHYLASRIIDLMPSHIHYVEPFLGGGSVLLAKDPEGISEVANDLDGNLMAFWKVLQNEHRFDLFRRRIEATPFSEPEFDNAIAKLETVTEAGPILRAVWFFIVARMSMAGRQSSFAPLSRTRTRRGQNEQTSAWWNCIEGLPAVAERLKRVVIFNKPAVEVIQQQDGQQTLFYCDPPYCSETRSSPDVYHHEMSQADHIELLGVLGSIKGKTMLSGYANDLYDTRLANWNRHDFDLPNNAASGSTKQRKTECIWCNF